MNKEETKRNKTSLNKEKEREVSKQTIHDLAFNKGPRLVYVRKKPEPKLSLEKTNLNKETSEAELSKVQEILQEFIEKKLSMGWHIKQIEKILEQNTLEGNYSILDVFKAIDYTIKKKLGKEKFPKLPAEHTPINKQTIPTTPNIVTTTKIQNNKIYKQESPQKSEDEDNSEEQLLDFLTKNPKHEYATTELYRVLGLSARQGNKIKNKLLDKGKIKIEQIKNTKGWKKIIRLT